MSNIYLRLPTAICYYHRNRDENHQLSCFEPMKVSKYDEVAIEMRRSLIVYASRSSRTANCYSQQQWKNILNGKNPYTGKTAIKRDPEEWPTYNEICAMTGAKVSNRSDSYDFLCIQIPNTILIGDKEVRTNSSFILPNKAAETVQEILTRDFQRALIDWEIGTQDFCINEERIIRRSHMETLERFLMRYNIPVAADGLEKESLRRQLARWLDNARVLEKAYRSYDIEYISATDKVISRKKSK